MDSRAWWAIVHGVAVSWARLSTHAQVRMSKVRTCKIYSCFSRNLDFLVVGIIEKILPSSASVLCMVYNANFMPFTKYLLGFFPGPGRSHSLAVTPAFIIWGRLGSCLSQSL